MYGTMTSFSCLPVFMQNIAHVCRCMGQHSAYIIARVEVG